MQISVVIEYIYNRGNILGKIADIVVEILLQYNGAEIAMQIAIIADVEASIII